MIVASQTAHLDDCAIAQIFFEGSSPQVRFVSGGARRSGVEGLEATAVAVLR